MTFRLPATSIEKYHLIDDRPSNPNVIGGNLTFSGQIDWEVANLAAEQTLRRHPLLCAHLERGRFGRWYWVADEKSFERVTWEMAEPGARIESPQVVDPRQRPLRLIVWKKGDQTVVGFRLHHAAVDGLAAFQALTDWLIAYHRIQTQSDRPKLRQLDPGRLRARNHLRLLSRKFLFKLWIQPIAMLGASKFIFRKVENIADFPGEPNRPADEEFQLITRELSGEALDNLQRQAEAARATVNELLIRSVFLGLHQFRRQSGKHTPGEWLRLMIPINIRDYSDRRLPAANRASIVQLDRTDRDFADPEGLIWTFNYELGNIRKWNLEKTFLLLVRCMSLFPGLLRRSARKQVCRATSVLTNLGAPMDRVKLPRNQGKIVAGNLTLDDFDLIVPLRPLTPVGFAALRYAGVQRLGMHFDPRQISRENANQLIDFVDQELHRGCDARPRGHSS